ncbi:nuclear transport factor 2 family protein [Aquimarina muelleri]|uniref:Lumazine-binding n=1 Tax=Aquimarina muelleri TaxID=279356 RepID=A0A918JSH0_9FLAO|nr:nuclear transport factor 2 family protein [Aquimarina muelleri]MCX2765063.1 nuclear transport factor 2 family protein [Aquimarina muelleri]GGX02831.1 hypothetical protein GCM10007384_00710 [Aquimarina muelleri]
MKHILATVLFSLFFLGAVKSQDITKEELQIRAFTNRDYSRVINYDKSFVSDDRLFYESLYPSQNSIQKLSDVELVKKTLKKYIEGSSYNRLEMLESAFTVDATLYLTVRDEFKKLTLNDYIAFFKNNKEGEFNGRIGNILSTEIHHDIAIAKAEILISERKNRFIDLFLLKKTKDGWKIISKTATRTDKER